MFGKILGSIVSAPIRIISVPVKIVQKSAQAADEFMLGKSADTYKAPRRNILDKAADAVSDACEESFGE